MISYNDDIIPLEFKILKEEAGNTCPKIPTKT